MDYAPIPLKRRNKTLERFEPLIADHTSTDVFKECPKKYFFKIVLGYRSAGGEIFFAWGGAYHKFREILDKSGNIATATEAGRALWKEKQGKDPEVGSKHDFLTEARLIKTFLAAYKHWEQEKKQGIYEILDVELPFNVELPDGSRSSGRIDAILRWRGRVWVRDYKTSSQEGEFFERSLEPNDQFTRYIFAAQQLCGEPVQGALIEVMFNKRDHKTDRGKSDVGPTIKPYMTARTNEQVMNWAEDTMHWNRMITHCRETDTWPMNETSCRYCEFHQVCKLPTEPAQEYALKSSDYVHSPWDNTKV
jgi:RecB family exonuclease